MSSFSDVGVFPILAALRVHARRRGLHYQRSRPLRTAVAAVTHLGQASSHMATPALRRVLRPLQELESEFRAKRQRVHASLALVCVPPPADDCTALAVDVLGLAVDGPARTVVDLGVDTDGTLPGKALSNDKTTLSLADLLPAPLAPGSWVADHSRAVGDAVYHRGILRTSEARQDRCKKVSFVSNAAVVNPAMAGLDCISSLSTGPTAVVN